jgi:type II secretory pathway pseudopilin PulG
MRRGMANPTGHESPNGEAGLTLPEVIVALGILALSLGGLFGLLSDGLRRTRQAEVMAEAASLTQSLLARVGTELELRPGIATGEAAGHRWRLEIAPYGDAADARAWPVAAYMVTAEVEQEDTPLRRVRISTLRLGSKETKP